MRSARWKAHIGTLTVFLLTAVLSVFFVPTHDDLLISVCQPLREAFVGAMYFGNGRFFGNTAVRMFLNSTVLDTLIRAVCICGCITMPAILTKGYQARTIWFSALLCLGIGFPISKQVFVWGNGFYNYVPPVFLLLVVLCLLKWYDGAQKSPWRWVAVVGMFLSAFSAQLFCENSTTINLLITVVLFLWVVLKKRPKTGAVIALLGMGFGALVMFLGPTLLGVADKLKEYRSVESSLSGVLRTGVKNAYEIVTTLATS